MEFVILRLGLDACKWQFQRYPELESAVGFHSTLRLQFAVTDTNFGGSILSVFKAALNSSPTPLISMVPLMATRISAPSMEIVCTTSVQTTAFSPPFV